MATADYGESFWVNLHSLDLGDINSPDGRAHPLTAMTPVVAMPCSTCDGSWLSNSNAPAQFVDNANTHASSGFTNPFNFSLPSLPSHFGARMAIGVLALGLLLIVAFRLTK